MFNYRFYVILSHKKFTCIDFGRVYIPYIPPVATPLEPTPHTLSVYRPTFKMFTTALQDARNRARTDQWMNHCCSVPCQAFSVLLADKD